MNTAEFELQPGQEFFEGDYRIKMAELREAGYIPLSTEDIMDARNAVPAKHPLWNNYIDTDFGIAATKKTIYLAPHSARLRAVTPQTKLTNYGLVLGADDIATMLAYDRKDHILGRDLTEDEVRDSRIWLDFAVGDQTRLDKYVENTFRFGKDKFGYDTMMGIFVPEDKELVERAVVLDRLYNGSRADGNVRLYDNTRFVGVRSGASVSELEVPLGATREPKLLSAPATIESNKYGHQPELQQHIYNPSELEYARRLLDGGSSGTVMDWKIS